MSVVIVLKINQTWGGNFKHMLGSVFVIVNTPYAALLKVFTEKKEIILK